MFYTLHNDFNLSMAFFKFNIFIPDSINWDDNSYNFICANSDSLKLPIYEVKNEQMESIA